jgi:hypothetical protein
MQLMMLGISKVYYSRIMLVASVGTNLFDLVLRAHTVRLTYAHRFAVLLAMGAAAALVHARLSHPVDDPPPPSMEVASWLSFSSNIALNWGPLVTVPPWTFTAAALSAWLTAVNINFAQRRKLIMIGNRSLIVTNRQ